MSETVCYKIRDSETGLWSSGGYEPKFTTKGKAWSGTGPLLSHLHQFWRSKYYRDPKTWEIPESWEVVKFVIVEMETEAPVNARAMIMAQKDKK